MLKGEHTMEPENKICELKIGGLEVEVWFIAVYAPKEDIREFNKDDIENRRIICSNNLFIVCADSYRVLLKIVTQMENCLGDMANDGEIKFFKEIRENCQVIKYANKKCSEEHELVVYYEK